MTGSRRPLEATRVGPGAAPEAASDAVLALGAILVASLGALIGLGIVSREPAAFPALLIGGALAVFLLAKPQWIVPSFIAVTWAALPGHVFGGLPSPVEVGGFVLLGVAAWRAPERPLLTARLLLIMFLLAVPLVVSAALSPEGSTFPLADLREVLFLFIAALCVFGVGSAERVVLALVVVGLILGLGGISSVLIGPSDLFPVITDVETALEPEAARAAGPFGEPNFYALSLAALTPLALFIVSKGGWRRQLGIATLVAIAGAILAAGSRGAALAMLFALLAVAITTPNRELRLAALATVLAAAALIPLFAGQTDNSVDRSVGGRQTENRIALAMLGDHPIVGVGPGSYEVLYRDYSRNIGNDPRPIREPHSLPLEIAAEQGIVGLLGWLLAGVVAFSHALSRGIWRTTLGRALLLSVATYGVGSIFLHGSQLRLLFILTGVTLAYAAQYQENTPKDEVGVLA